MGIIKEVKPEEIEPVEEYKETTWEKICDFIVEWTPSAIYSFYCNYLKPSAISRKIEFWWQRKTRGFDDSETWDLDYSFVRWLLPRLKRFSEVVGGYPATDEYPTFESWKTELKHRVEQLELIVKYIFDDFEFPDVSWSKLDNPNKSLVCSDAFDKCYEDFMIWFNKWHRHLWW